MVTQEFSILPLSSIDPDDNAYRITRAGEVSPALGLSVQTLGLMTPLTVVPNGNPGNPAFTLVSGFRRFAVIRSLNMETVPCRILPAGNPGNAARLAVVENAFGRTLGPGELVRAAALLSRHMDIPTMADESAQLFNQTLNRGYIGALIRISGLGETALDLLDSEQVTIKTARAISEMNAADAGAVLALFSRIKASSGKQMEILTWTKEIGARDKTGIPELLEKEEICSAIDPDQGNQDLGTAANRLRAVLFARRFPELNRMKKEAAALVKNLKLPANLRLALPENFESTTVTFSMTIATMDDYEKTVRALSDLGPHDSLARILNR